MEAVINIGLYVSYVLLGLAILSSIVLPLINSLDDKAALIKAGIGIGIIIALYGISWAISGNEVTEAYIKRDVGEGISRAVGGSLIMMYVLFLVAIVGIIYTEISKVIK